MAGAIEKLIGADASLERATFGAPLATGSAQNGKWYKIVAKSGDTVFPAGYIVGDLIQGDALMTFSATNSASLATFESVADCSSFSFDISSDEIEVSVLLDSVKKYRKGRSDMSGTISGINFISIMKQSGSILNRFLRVVSGDSQSIIPAVMNNVDNSAYYIRALLQDDVTTVGESQVFLFGQVELFGYKLGADVGSAQTWESGCRFNGNDPIVYIMENKAAT